MSARTAEEAEVVPVHAAESLEKPGRGSAKYLTGTKRAQPPPNIQRAKQLIAAGVEELVRAQISRGVMGSEWIDQNASPLGRRRHLELVRKGRLAGARSGKKVLVRRADIEAYLTERVMPVDPGDEDDRAVEEFIAILEERK